MYYKQIWEKTGTTPQPYLNDIEIWLTYLLEWLEIQLQRAIYQ
jgi:hypothetical protein